MARRSRDVRRDQVLSEQGPDSPAFPVRVTWLVVVGAAAWTLSVVFFVVQGVAQARFTPGFDMASNLISDLGRTACTPAACSPLYGLVNATFVTVGALHWLGAIVTLEAWPKGRRAAVGRALLALAGVGLLIVGLAPEDVRAAAHARGAVLGLLCLNLAMIALGSAVFSARRWLGTVAGAAGWIGLIGFVLFVAHVLPAGLAERLADYPAAAMVVVFGVVLLVAAGRVRPRPERSR